MATIIVCEAPGCHVSIEDVSEVIAIARFNSHMLHHSGNAGAGQPALQRAPKMERPRISQDSSEEVWMNFVRRWNLFKKCTSMKAEELQGQLFLCCDDELGNHLLKIDPLVTDSTESLILEAIKKLAVIPVAISVRRAELIQMQQSHGENIRSFYAKVKGKAATCVYTIRCSCDPATDVDFTNLIIRDVVIAGLSDIDIRKEVLGLPELDNKNIVDVVAIIEGKEMARNALAGSASASLMSAFKKQSSGVPGSPNTAICPECSCSFVPYTDGPRGRNTKPHRVCLDCWKRTRHRQQARKVDNKTDRGKTDIATSALMLQLCTMAHAAPNKPVRPSRTRLDHHIFTRSGWAAARTLTHPKVQLRLTTNKDDYQAFDVSFPQISPMHLAVITDTGAQSCLWSRNSFDNSGLRSSDLIPVNYGMMAANKSNIRIDGAVILRLEGKDMRGRSVECAAMTYISPDADNFYLSKEAMTQLGIISTNFPQVGSAFVDSVAFNESPDLQ
jgi:hypothetical protein